MKKVLYFALILICLLCFASAVFFGARYAIRRKQAERIEKVASFVDMNSPGCIWKIGQMTPDEILDEFIMYLYYESTRDSSVNEGLKKTLPVQPVIEDYNDMYFYKGDVAGLEHEDAALYISWDHNNHISILFQFKDRERAEAIYDRFLGKLGAKENYEKITTEEDADGRTAYGLYTNYSGEESRDMLVSLKHGNGMYYLTAKNN